MFYVLSHICFNKALKLTRALFQRWLVYELWKIPINKISRNDVTPALIRIFVFSQVHWKACALQAPLFFTLTSWKSLLHLTKWMRSRFQTVLSFSMCLFIARSRNAVKCRGAFNPVYDWLSDVCKCWCHQGGGWGG